MRFVLTCVTALSVAVGGLVQLTPAHAKGPKLTPKKRDKYSAECRSDAYKKACSKWMNFDHIQCKVIPIGNFGNDELKQYPDAIKNFKKNLTAYKNWYVEWGGCGEQKGCRLPTYSTFPTCEKAPEAMRKPEIFDKLIKSLEHAKMVAGQRIAAAEREARPYEIGKLKESIEIFKPYVGFKFRTIPADIMAILPKLEAAVKKTEAARQAKLMKINCGAHKHKSKKLAKTIMKVIRAGEKARAGKSKKVITMKKIQLLGPPRKSHNAWKKLTFEDLPVRICNTYKDPGKPAYCRMVEIRFRRQKPARGKWTQWKGAGVGRSEAMSCKNLGLK